MARIIAGPLDTAFLRLGVSFFHVIPPPKTSLWLNKISFQRNSATSLYFGSLVALKARTHALPSHNISSLNTFVYVPPFLDSIPTSRSFILLRYVASEVRI